MWTRHSTSYAMTDLLPELQPSVWCFQHIALFALVAGLYLIYDGNIETGDPIAAISSIVLIANMALFAWIVWRKVR